jgi:hypothetical protein
MDSRHSLRFSNVRFISLPAFAATPVLIGMLGGGMFTRAVAVGSEANASAIGFEADIRPLLIAKCGDCHGPETQESGLRLDVRHRAMKGGDFGPVILAGNAAESELVKRITHRDPEHGKRCHTENGASHQIWVSLQIAQIWWLAPFLDVLDDAVA